jgi:hypothetical protein
VLSFRHKWHLFVSVEAAADHVGKRGPQRNDSGSLCHGSNPCEAAY